MLKINKKVKDIIFSLLEKEDIINNNDVYQILKKYESITDDKIVETDIKEDCLSIKNLNKERIKEINEYNVKNNFRGEFSNRGIYTINDLYKFMNDNFEYGGVLVVDNARIKLPFGPVNGVSKNNIITRYQDENIFNFIVDFYSKLNGNDEIIGYVREQYNNKDIDICTFKEYQQIIYEVSLYVQGNMWKQRNISEILKDQISNCYESSFLVGEFLKNKGIKYQKYMIGRYDNIALAHMFITYTIDNKYYYFEHALNDFKGIYEYSSKDDMEQDVFMKFIYNDNFRMDNNLNFDNYFLKPIEDLDPNVTFASYFKYFNTIDTVKIPAHNYNVLTSLTKLVFKEMLSVGKIYFNGVEFVYKEISLPLKEEFYDIELWNKKVYHILRKNIINIGFCNENKVFTINTRGGFNKYIVNTVEKNTKLTHKKIVPNIYTIEDLEKELISKQVVKVKDMLMLTLLLENKHDLYEYGCNFASRLSSEIIKNLNNKEKGKILCTKEDIHLDGTIGTNLLFTNEDFLKQIIPIVSSLEMVCDSIKFISGKDFSKDLISTFVDYFIYMIDKNTINIEKIKNEPDNNSSSFIDEVFAKLIGNLLNSK